MSRTPQSLFPATSHILVLTQGHCWWSSAWLRASLPSNWGGVDASSYAPAAFLSSSGSWAIHLVPPPIPLLQFSSLYSCCPSKLAGPRRYRYPHPTTPPLTFALSPHYSILCISTVIWLPTCRRLAERRSDNQVCCGDRISIRDVVFTSAKSAAQRRPLGGDGAKEMRTAPKGNWKRCLVVEGVSSSLRYIWLREWMVWMASSASPPSVSPLSQPPHAEWLVPSLLCTSICRAKPWMTNAYKRVCY